MRSPVLFAGGHPLEKGPKVSFSLTFRLARRDFPVVSLDPQSCHAKQIGPHIWSSRAGRSPCRTGTAKLSYRSSLIIRCLRAMPHSEVSEAMSSQGPPLNGTRVAIKGTCTAEREILIMSDCAVASGTAFLISTRPGPAFRIRMQVPGRAGRVGVNPRENSELP